ncbi:MAG: choice-of-anchor L domain-containing protein [Acidimicrobiales bacterium]
MNAPDHPPAHPRRSRTRRRPRRGLAASLVALTGLLGTVGTLAITSTTAGTAAAAPAAGGGGAAATVANGIATTDLAAVGASPSGLASSLVGPGVTVSNVTYTGAPAQAGLLHVVDPAVVSFNDGVIMSSGNFADIVGPNKSDSTTGDMAGSADADLNALIAGTKTVNPVTFDAASLEFDFVPTASQVYFTYTFSSDEYLEWVNLFNDVFAFYVNGQNCAVTPGGDTVSIDTINDAVNPSLFRDNSFSNPPANPINIESDGLSVEMICSAPVNPGQTNHMKLAIADTSDQILDSVVMIKAHSLSTVPPESCNDNVDNDDDTFVDMEDPSCQASTTPPPAGSGGSGVGSGGSAPAFTGNEGTPIKLDASVFGWTATPDAISTTWTVHGINGTVGDCTIDPATPQPVGPGGAIAVVSATCPVDGEYVARVDGLDVEGKSAFDKDVDFFVHNAPPAVTIDSPTIGDQASVGDPVTVSATVVDPGVDDGISCDISWGDGTVEPGDLAGTTCSGTHTYAEPGAKIISVTGSDTSGQSAAAASLIDVVSLQATTTSLGSTVSPTVAGQATNLVAEVSATGGGATPTGTVDSTTAPPSSAPRR